MTTSHSSSAKGCGPSSKPLAVKNVNLELATETTSGCVSDMCTKFEPQSQVTSDPVANSQNEETPYLKGWRKSFLTTGIWISLFLSTLETTVVSTSLVSISNSLNGFEIRNWIVTAYFLTYTGFLIIYPRLSDIFGRKTMFLLALLLFTAFSIGCGATSDMTTLIVLRAFQGMGASGIYSMVLVIAPHLVPREEYGKYIGIISSVFALASIAGPLIGGAIADHGSWRWVFLLNAPAGVLAIILIALFLPSESSEKEKSIFRQLLDKFAVASFRKIDINGLVLSLIASVMLVFALQEGGTRYSWGSGPIITAFVLSGIAWIAFVLWELHLEHQAGIQQPIFPMKLLKISTLGSMMATTCFIGFPFVAVLFAIPQRTQAVNGYSPVRAGLALLPLLLTSPAATAVSGVLTSNYNVPPVYLIISGTCFQLLGVGLTIRLPAEAGPLPPEIYGYEVIMGIGFGLTLSTVLTLAQLVTRKEDAGLVMGALTQIRVLGGTVALAICAAVLSNEVTPKLMGIVGADQLQQISESFSSIDRLDASVQSVVRNTFAMGYQKQLQLLTGFSGAALVSSLFLLPSRNIRVKADPESETRVEDHVTA